MVKPEDEKNLLSFQRRLMEISKSYVYQTRRMYWGIALTIFITGAHGYFWYNHAKQNNIPWSEMYWSMPSFTITLFLSLIFMVRFYNVANARVIIMNNMREELKRYELTCTDDGILILKHTFQPQFEPDGF